MNDRIENTELMLETDIQMITNKMTLFRLLHKCFGWEFYSVGILKFIADCTSFMGPILLNKFVGFVEYKNEAVTYGYLYASLIFISALIGRYYSILSNTCKYRL